LTGKIQKPFLSTGTAASERIHLNYFHCNSISFFAFFFSEPARAAAVVIAANKHSTKDPEVKSKEPVSPPLSPAMLSQVANSLNHVEEHNENDEITAPPPSLLLNAVNEKRNSSSSSSSSSSASSSASSSPSILRKLSTGSDSRLKFVLGGIEALETPRHTHWTGNGMTMNIIETSSFK